ncbi:MAG: NUDIX domain-containing protein [Propionibacteriaceae bacterium]|nr:NUDIX domain-containing protein [Propionibacteriaceae bacterium]
MSEPSRTFVPVPPAQRRRRIRKAVRVIVTDGERVLLLRDSDPGTGDQWWFTPGGGIDPGESQLAAVVRELREETGLEITESQAIGPVATRRVIHGFSDVILDQEESFYRVRTPMFELDTAGHTPDEQVTLLGHRWIRVDELGSLAKEVWPANLAAICSADKLLDLGTVEESTVPVATG